MGAFEFQPDGCRADCDESGTLDLLDFLCFQNLFAAGDPAPDCDGSGALDFFDFLCFQNEFSIGCPAGLEYIDLGVHAPPTAMCGESMSPFSDSRPDFTMVDCAPSPLGGAVSFSIPMSKRTVGFTWGTWSHGYSGPVYYTQGFSSVTMGVPANSAFYFYTEPGPFAGFEMRVTASGAGDEIVTGPVFVSGRSGALGFGYCGGVEKILVEWVSGGGGSTDFAVGEFGIAN